MRGKGNQWEGRREKGWGARGTSGKVGGGMDGGQGEPEVDAESSLHGRPLQDALLPDTVWGSLKASEPCTSEVTPGTSDQCRYQWSAQAPGTVAHSFLSFLSTCLPPRLWRIPSSQYAFLPDSVQAQDVAHAFLPVTRATPRALSRPPHRLSNHPAPSCTHSPRQWAGRVWRQETVRKWRRAALTRAAKGCIYCADCGARECGRGGLLRLR